MPWDEVHDLIRHVQMGDRTAWQPLFVLVQPYLLRLAQDFLGPGWPDGSVSDLTQETWVRAWQGLPDFRGGEDATQTAALFRAWLARIMKNVRLNQQRFQQSQRRRPPPGTIRLDAAGDSTAAHVEPPARDPTPSSGPRDEEQCRLINQALEQLADPTDRDIIRLHFFEGLSLTAIAGRLQLTLDRVRKGFHRSLARLKPPLDDLA
jgi:RNA polymerase sigma factor (sigma-70 family)